MNEIKTIRILNSIFQAYPDVYAYVVALIHSNKSQIRQPEKLTLPPLDYQGFRINRKFVENNKDVINWHQLMDEYPEEKWLRDYYLEYLLENKRLHEYDLLTEEIIEGNEDLIDWDKLARAPAISKVTAWNVDFLVKYWNFLKRPKSSSKKTILGRNGRRPRYNIWANPAIPWDRKTFELLKGNLEWEVSKQINNRNIPWRREELKYFKNLGKDTYLAQGYWISLSDNINLDWSAELIEDYKDFWRWDLLSENESFCLNRDLLDKFKELWSWSLLSKRIKVEWSLDLLKNFQKEWDWDVLSENENLPWTEELLEEYENLWDWKRLSLNKRVHQDHSILLKFEEKWYWKELSSNEEVSWSEFLIDKYKNEINFKLLTRNKNIVFHRKLLLNYKERWDWSILSRKESLPWTYELLEKVEKEVYWSYLTSNRGLPWSIHLVEKYAERWNWANFYYNNFHNLPIDLKFVQKFIHNILNVDVVSATKNLELKFPDSIQEIFDDLVSKNLLPHSTFLNDKKYINCENLAEKARQYLLIHKPVTKDEWIEVSLLKILFNQGVRSINTGDRFYHYYTVVFSCATEESIKKAHSYYSNGNYKESLEALQSITATMEQDDLSKSFIGQKFMIKISYRNKIDNNDIHPVNWYNSLLPFRIT